MTIYLIYSEINVGIRFNVGRIIRFFEVAGYKLITAKGSFMGVTEDSLIIEIIGSSDREFYDLLVMVCEHIKRTNKQEKVLLTYQDINTELI